jgi:galactonate dehydratase
VLKTALPALDTALRDIEGERLGAPVRRLLGLMLPEKPVWRESNVALGTLAAQSPGPLAGGEGLLHRWQFLDVLEAKGTMIIQPGVEHCGGITEMRKIAALGEAYGVEAAPHIWDGYKMRLLYELTLGTLPLAGEGQLKLPDKPGFGFKLDFASWRKRFPYN